MLNLIITGNLRRCPKSSGTLSLTQSASATTLLWWSPQELLVRIFFFCKILSTHQNDSCLCLLWFPRTIIDLFLLSQTSSTRMYRLPASHRASSSSIMSSATALEQGLTFWHCLCQWHLQLFHLEQDFNIAFMKIFNSSACRCWTAGWGKDEFSGSFQFIQHKVGSTYEKWDNDL